ncbi:MAG: acyloxyacyl hydrolase [Gracilimonas sp.]|nr:acyloxyacyl hydrolase [Gracilimonas sp.]
MKFIGSHRSTIHLLIIGFLFLITHSELYGQNRPTSITPETRYTIWGGYSSQSIRFLGKTQNSQTQILRFGFQKHLKNLSEDISLWYTAGIIPYLHFDYPKRDANDRKTKNSGYGISPFGFMVKNYKSDLFSPFAQTTAGIIYMDDYFPTDKARRLNFTFDIIIGNIFKLNSFTDLSLGYKFHHISNAQTGSQNPGLDSNFLFLTLSVH